MKLPVIASLSAVVFLIAQPALAQDPASESLQRADALREAGDINGAIAALTGVIDADPGNGRAYFRRGFLLVGKGDSASGMADFTKAIELNAGEANVYYNRGLLKAQEGDLEGAIADCTKAVELSPEDADAYFNRGLAFTLKGDTAGARADYSKVIELKPGDAQAYFNRGNSAYAAGDIPAALADYSRTIELSPGSPEAFSMRALARLASGDADGAIADCTSAIEHDPKFVTAYNSRGLAKMSKSEFDAAIVDFSAAIERDPRFEQAYFNRARAAELKANPVKTIATDPLPQGPWVFLEEGIGRRASGDLPGAVELFREGAKQDSLQCAFWLFLTEAELGRRDLGAAELSSVLDRRWKSGPSDWSSQLGNYLLRKTSDEDLFALAEAGRDEAEQRQRYCEAWFYTGMLKQLAGEREEARSCFRKAVGTERKDLVEYHQAQRALEHAATAISETAASAAQ